MAYIKTEWVNGETPINESNLNNIENGINELQPEIITGALLTSHLIAANNTYEFVNLSEYSKVGSNLSIEDGKIVIGSGISKVFVEYKGQIIPSANGQKYLSLYKNEDERPLVSHVYGVASQRTEVTQIRVPLDVTEGDTLYLQTYGALNDEVEVNRLFMTVEKIC